ncbi:MAG: Na+/H+ antiporter subunit E [Pseudomonadota bacterium]
MRLLLITATLFGYWLLLSGEWGHAWLIWAGGILSLAVVGFSLFKGLTDEEGFPVENLPRGLVYWPWLGWQIVLSALTVTRIVLDPKLPISPSMVKVPADQDTAVGIATYANSITLTPGTISVEVSESGKAIWVHAITRAGADGMEDDEMNLKVAWMEGLPVERPS